MPFLSFYKFKLEKNLIRGKNLENFIKEINYGC